jgi:hypothetical protein
LLLDQIHKSKRLESRRLETKMKNAKQASKGLDVDPKARVTAPIKPDPAIAKAKPTVDPAFRNAAPRVDIGRKRRSRGL